MVYGDWGFGFGWGLVVVVVVVVAELDWFECWDGEVIRRCNSFSVKVRRGVVRGWGWDARVVLGGLRREGGCC